MTDNSNNTRPVVLITGSARRIGAAIAHTLHRAGMRTCIHYRHSQVQAQALCEALNQKHSDSACCVQGDLCDPQDIERIGKEVLNKYQRLDALVNNASEFYPTPIGKLDSAQFDDLIASNLKGPALLIQQLVPALRTHRGCIVNISDIHARVPNTQHSVYCAAKAGLEGLGRALALDLAPQIRVNTIAPGAILWPENQTSSDSVAAQKILDSIALKRLGNENDIAEAVLFLIRDASYVTGQVLNVDGGRR